MVKLMYASETDLINDTGTQTDALSARENYLKLQFAAIALVYATLLTVKGSFLLLSRARGRISRVYDCCWWLVLGFVFLSWLGCMVSLPIFGEPFVYGEGNNLLAWLRCTTVFDVIGDGLVLALYAYFCWTFRGDRRCAIALCGLFLLVVAVALATVARVVVGKFTKAGPEPSWFALCSVIEGSLAVCVCCLASYIGLFIDPSGFCERTWAKLDPEKGLKKRPQYLIGHARGLYKHGTHTSAYFHAQARRNGQEVIKSPIPSHAVKVKTELVVENEPIVGAIGSPPPYRAQAPLPKTLPPQAQRPRRASESRCRPAAIHDSYIRTYPGREPYVYPTRVGPAKKHRPSLSWQSSSTTKVARLEQPRRHESAALRTSTPPFKVGKNGLEIQRSTL
ncbi:MAG: hypothetical protein M1814_004909 [Vezdaea aestivalis]|nr:MAG: hypothetical protein M1814_004909 [Vezdaea aestivalis]